MWINSPQTRALLESYFIWNIVLGIQWFSYILVAYTPRRGPNTSGNTMMSLFVHRRFILYTEMESRPGPWFNIKMSSNQYSKSHCGDKTILRPSYLHNGISYTGKTTSLYWIRASFQYLIRRLIVRCHEEVLKPQDLYLELYDRSEIWQAAVLLMCLSHFKAIRKFKLPISRFRLFTISCDRTSYRILKRIPGLHGMLVLRVVNDKIETVDIFRFDAKQNSYLHLTIAQLKTQLTRLGYGQ